jgi:hypothetical protein
MIRDVRVELERHGLLVLGGFEPEPEDGLPADVATVVMVGNVGSAIYPHLRRSPEFGAPQPLDHWTRRVVGEVAASSGAMALFPFDGPPYHPFQAWAMRADGRFSPSPLGLLIHESFGLWSALRAALLFDRCVDIRPIPTSARPCDSCTTRPCLSACPVGAFRPEHYDVVVCRAHLGTLSGQDCMMGGCLARRACPVGRPHAYDRVHAGFHMRAFQAAGRTG